MTDQPLPAAPAATTTAPWPVPTAYTGVTPDPWATPPAPRRSALGVIAFLAAVTALVIGAILAAMAGQVWVGLAEFVALDGTVDESSPAAIRTSTEIFGLGTLAIAVWAALALWAFVQGIVATAMGRGRAWGVAAIVLAPVSGAVCVGVYVATVFAAVGTIGEVTNLV